MQFNSTNKLMYTNSLSVIPPSTGLITRTLGPSNDFTLFNGWIYLHGCVRLSRMHYESLHFHSFIHTKYSIHCSSDLVRFNLFMIFRRSGPQYPTPFHSDRSLRWVRTEYYDLRDGLKVKLRCSTVENGTACLPNNAETRPGVIRWMQITFLPSQ